MEASALSDLLGSEVVHVKEERLCSLWAGYGSIVTLHLSYRTKRNAASPASVVLKKISPPKDSGEAHERKIKSYVVEAAFYQHFCSAFLALGIAVPHPYQAAIEPSGSAMLLLSDLRINYPILGDGMLNWDKTVSAVDWLARFHAYHWNLPDRPTAQYSHLWPEGCYWRLNTRMSVQDIPMSWERLKRCARVVANLLKNGTDRDQRKHRTLVHGDFKSANIQFSEKLEKAPMNRRDSGVNGSCSNSSDKISADVPTDFFSSFECAALDFQYVGVGYGARDVAKLIVSSVDMDSNFSGESKKGGAGSDKNGTVWLVVEKRVLDTYYELLSKYIREFSTNNLLDTKRSDNLSYSREELQRHYELSLVDYVRFMTGWGMWGNTKYAATRTLDILYEIDAGATLTTEEYEEKFMRKYFSE